MDSTQIGDLVTIVTIIGTVVLSIGFLKIVSMWTSKKQSMPNAMPTYDPEAIARLQASIDAISIEVERISEGQRFTTRLLSEKLKSAAELPERTDSLVGQ